MQQTAAIALIQNAITGNHHQRWADLDCGSGTFTTALNNILPTGSHITAVDKQTQNVPVDFLKADFAKDDLPLSNLDGILMANSFHYIRDKQKLVKKLEAYLSADSTFLMVEYDTSRFNTWVPYPITYQNLQKLFIELGYSSINKLAELPSRFGGHMYSALIRF